MLLNFLYFCVGKNEIMSSNNTIIHRFLETIYISSFILSSDPLSRR